MPLKFFIQKDGKTYGPVSSSDLMKLAQSGKLAPADLVWKEGTERKVPAERVKGLTFTSPQVAPTVPVQEDNPSPTNDSNIDSIIDDVLNTPTERPRKEQAKEIDHPQDGLPGNRSSSFPPQTKETADQLRVNPVLKWLCFLRFDSTKNMGCGGAAIAILGVPIIFSLGSLVYALANNKDDLLPGIMYWAVFWGECIWVPIWMGLVHGYKLVPKETRRHLEKEFHENRAARLKGEQNIASCCGGCLIIPLAILGLCFGMSDSGCTPKKPKPGVMFTPKGPRPIFMFDNEDE